MEPTESVSSSDEELIIVPSGGATSPQGQPSIIERESDSDSNSWLCENEIKSAIAQHVPPYVPPVSGFVVCRTNAKLRRLHFVGHCGKVSGVHYQNYVHFENMVPDSKEFDWQCIHCFGRSGTIVTEGIEAAAAAEAASAMSSDASSKEGAEGAAGTAAP